MSVPKVRGLDLSLTGTGVAGNGWAFTVTFPLRKKGEDKRDYEHRRIEHVGELVLPHCAGCDLVVIEGLPFGGFDTDRQNAGLSWMIRHSLWGMGVPYALLSPSALKLYITGSGARDPNKSRMMAAVRGWFEWFHGDDNAADAAGLWAAGRDWAGAPAIDVPASYRQALIKGKWPTNFAFAVDDIASGGGGELAVRNKP